MKKFDFIQVISIFLAIILLVLIRVFEDILFYDPLLDFFKTDYLLQSIPSMNLISLISNIVFRYLLNTFFSLLILWLLFKDRGIIKVSIFIYFVFFILVFRVFAYMIYFGDTGCQNTLLFYIRRFLIQPILLLVLLPAFFFQKSKSR